MLPVSENDLSQLPDQGAPVGGTLPAMLAFVQRAAGSLRAHLHSQGLGDWQIFQYYGGELADIDEHLAALGEQAAWEPAPPDVGGGEQASALTVDTEKLQTWKGGFLDLRRNRVVLARWQWPSDEGTYLRSFCLCAVPGPAQFEHLLQRVRDLNRRRGAAVWQIVGQEWSGRRVERQPPREDALFLPAAIRQRVAVDIVGFFARAVAELYRSMDVPYRRGVLLYGPPGNGKTSLIRHVGAALPEIPAQVLRPYANFDSDDLQHIFDGWAQQAPAILVIEDLDWLLGQINVSRFLNMLDGVESRATGGLLLLATTNHPDKLDPAVNNRPGRFDVVLELPPPEAELRRQFFQSRLAVDSETLGHLTRRTEGLSFAHLQEIVKLAGLLAIHAGRQVRVAADALGAAEQVITANRAAADGFPVKPEVPFGLAPRSARPGL